jgi:2-amino-4-hydroxy-6-hydroxymethyldihydropteridine diphosphokinase
MPDAALALIALGSNLAFEGVPPAGVVARAMEEVAALGQEAAWSRLWRSPAWPSGGPDYANAAMSLEVELAPEALLGAPSFHRGALGARAGRRWGARTLDLDLLAWGDAVRPMPRRRGPGATWPPTGRGARRPTG